MSRLEGETKNKAKNGGGGRDRTDDLKLAKLPLSQLSYAPGIFRKPLLVLCCRQSSTENAVSNHQNPSCEAWWAWVDSNYRPYAYQAYALTT